MKKIKNLLLASGLALLLLPTSAQAFSDTSGHWAQSQIAEAYSYGIVSGTSATTYTPDRNLTGQEFATMMVSAVLKEELSKQTGGWPEQYIKALEATIIDSSMPSITYEAGLTRFQAAQMVGGVLGSQGYVLSTISMAENVKAFTDMYTNSYIQKSYLAGLTLEAGIMSGTSATTFEPERVLTRAEGAVIVLNMAKHSLFEGSITLTPNTNTPSVDKYPSVDKNPSTDTSTPSVDKYPSVDKTPSTDTSTPSVDKYPSVDKTPSTDTSTPSVDKTPTTDTSTTTGTSQAELIAEVFRLVNVERAKVGLSPFIWHDTLMKSAQFKSDEMVELDYFSHTSPVYGSFSGIINRFNISWRACGENIAMGQRTAQAVMTSWMNSTGHKENILNSTYTHIGIGVNNYVWTQQFIA